MRRRSHTPGRFPLKQSRYAMILLRRWRHPLHFSLCLPSLSSGSREPLEQEDKGITVRDITTRGTVSSRLFSCGVCDGNTSQLRCKASETAARNVKEGNLGPSDGQGGELTPGRLRMQKERWSRRCRASAIALRQNNTQAQASSELSEHAVDGETGLQSMTLQICANRRKSEAARS